MQVNLKRYGLYLLHWQVCTPILAVGFRILPPSIGQLIAAMVANLMGGLIFFWVDQFTFTSQSFALYLKGERISLVSIAGWSQGIPARTGRHP